MKGLGKRVQVEGRQPAGCATCRLWDGVVVADSFGGRSLTDQCPDCGRILPPRLVIHLEGVRWDAVCGG